MLDRRSTSAARGAWTSDRAWQAGRVDELWTSTITPPHRNSATTNAPPPRRGVTADPHSVTDEQVADLRRPARRASRADTDRRGTCERMNSALDITEQGFNSGDACRIRVSCARRSFSGEPVNLSGWRYPQRAHLYVAHSYRV